MASSIRELRSLTDDELDAAIDAAPALEQTAWPLDWYLQELDRRRSEKQTGTMIRLTWAITAMTLASTLFVVLSALGVIG